MMFLDDQRFRGILECGVAASLCHRTPKCSSFFDAYVCPYSSRTGTGNLAMAASRPSHSGSRPNASWDSDTVNGAITDQSIWLTRWRRRGRPCLMLSWIASATDIPLSFAAARSSD